uniref:Crustocalcin-a n=1 Tax=Penaeus japonicus TaxID=27405 RepID=Q766V0_PENJP|nr:crustocalcin-a [Penaeus japonicus]
MKWVILVAALVGVAWGRTIFDYERDGLDNEQKGQPGRSVTGEYEWRAPDGKVVEISYVADHLGFRLVDDPETAAATQSSGAARTQVLGEEGEEAEEEDGGGGREVRTEEETEEEEGEEESEGRSEGTQEEEEEEEEEGESESSGNERSEEPEKEGAEGEEKSAEPGAEEAEGEEEAAEPEAKGAEAEGKSAETEKGKSDAEAEEEAEGEGASKKASEENADVEKAQEVEAASPSVDEVAAAEDEASEAAAESTAKQLNPETPALVPVKVESNFAPVSPVTEAPVIATAAMLPAAAPLVAPVTVETPAAPVPSPEVYSADSASGGLGSQDLVLVVIPPVEQEISLPNAEVVEAFQQPMPTAEISQPAFTDSDVVIAEQVPAEPMLLLPTSPLALIASPEGANVVLETPVFGKVEVSGPVGVPEIDADIAVLAKSSDPFQAAPQVIATGLSGGFEPVGDVPAPVSTIPVLETEYVQLENIPKMIRFDEFVEVSPEPASAPELPSPLPLIQVEGVDPSFVSVEISPAPLPQPDTNPSSLFSGDIEVSLEPQVIISPIVPPPFPSSLAAASDASFSVGDFALPSHRFEAPKSGRSMDSVPVVVGNSNYDTTNALFFVPESLQEEIKSHPSEVIEVAVPEESIMTVAKSLIQPPPMPVEPIAYRDTEVVETLEPDFVLAPTPSQTQDFALFVNSIPVSLKDESLFSAVEASPITHDDASPFEIEVVEVAAQDSFATLPEAVAQPLTGMQSDVPFEFEATANVQSSEVLAPEIAIFETDVGLEPLLETVGPNAMVTIITDDAPLSPLDQDDTTVLVSKEIQSPPLLPPLMKPSVLLN